MVKLIVYRHFMKRESEHETFEHAAIIAVNQFDNGFSYPWKILDGDEVIWEHGGPGGDTIMALRDIVTKVTTPVHKLGLMGKIIMARQPIQPIEADERGILRFKKNKIVRFLLDAGPFDLGQLDLMPFDNEDRNQFAQLIGYSLSGFGELDYVSEEMLERVEAQKANYVG